MSRQKTQKEFEEEVFNLVEDEYTVLGKYTGSKDKIKMRHNKCENKYRVKANSFLFGGNRCPECNNMRKTHKEFVKEVRDLVGEEYTILGRYINSKKKVKMKHNKCGDTWEITPNSFLQGSRCPKCVKHRLAKEKRRTHEKFIEEIKELVGDEYDVLGKYQKNDVKIKFRHNKCGYTWKTRPHIFLNGSRCPECAKKIRADKKTKTQEEFENEVYKAVGDEYTVLGQYQKYRVKVKMRHNKCGSEYKVKPGRFLGKGARCPECYATTKKTQEQFKKEVVEKGDKEYKVLGEYVNRKTKVKLRHKKCGNTWMVTPTSFLHQGTRCPKCSRGKSHKKFVKEIKEKYDGEYEVLGEYTKRDEKIRFKHKKCGTKFEKTPENFFSAKYECPYCLRKWQSEHRTKKHDKFVEEVRKLGDDEYEVLSEYNGNDNVVTFKHKSCDTKFTIPATYFIHHGKRCPKCTKDVRSEGELKIKKFLDERDIKYKRDYSFNGCRNKYKLQFDFVLFYKANYGKLFEDTVYYLIEYNGIQHYESIEYFGGQEKLERQQKRDKIKREYAKDNKIPFLVIKYTEKEKIEEILTDKICKRNIA